MKLEREAGSSGDATFVGADERIQLEVPILGGSIDQLILAPTLIAQLYFLGQFIDVAVVAVTVDIVVVDVGMDMLHRCWLTSK